MPRRLPVPCAEPGCPALVRYGRCEAHQRPRVRTRTDDAYDERRGSRHARGYGKDHERWRLAVLARDALCVLCLKGGVIVRATEADHIVPKRDGGGNELSNGQGLCGRCHRAKTAAETAARKRT